MNRIQPHEMIGRRFGRLLVVKLAETRPRASGRGRRFFYECVCDCGAVAKIVMSNLRSGMAKSCGCLKSIRTKEVMTKHKDCASPEYHSWQAMKARCCNPNSAKYPDYGGRGIKICDRWLNSYENFLADTGRRPSPRHTIDRKDNDGNYEPGNCRWATPKEQSANKRQRRDARLIEWNGRTKTLTEWARDRGLPINLLHYRLEKGWSAERALSQPQRKWARRSA
jgi:hypothetical protein